MTTREAAGRIALSVAHQHLSRHRFSADQQRGLRQIGDVFAAEGAIEHIAQQLLARTEGHRIHQRFYRHIATLGQWDGRPDWLVATLDAWFEVYLAGGRIDEAMQSLRQAIEFTADAAHGAEEIHPLLNSLFALVGGALADFHAATACRTDFDTGLPNRTALTEILEDREGGAQDDLAVLLVQVDGLMPATLAKAHLALCVQALVQRLSEVLRGDDVLFALSDVEFGVLLPVITTPMQARLAATAIAKALRRPLVVDDHLVRISPAIGVAIASEVGFDATRLIGSARIATSLCRSRGSRFTVFSDAMATAAAADARLEMAVIKAFNNNQLVVYLQPQIDIQSGRCVSAEALLRWQQNHVSVAPSELLRVLHKAGHLIDFTHWLVKSVCRMSAELTRQGMPLPLSLNLFAEDFADDEILDLFEMEMEFWKVERDRLRIEIVEGSPVLVDARIRHTFQRLSDMGVRLSMDDFGAGYSSLLQLRELPVDEIKLDRAFIEPAATSPRDAAIVESAVALAHALNLTVVAEGVTSTEVLHYLRSIGCDLAQGYLFAEPMPLDVFIGWAQRHEENRQGLVTSAPHSR